MREYIYADEEIYMNRAYYEEEDLEYLADTFSMREISLLEVELIEDEVDIDNIEELHEWVTRRNGEVTQTEDKILEIGNKTNELVKTVKQLNKEIKSIKEK